MNLAIFDLDNTLLAGDSDYLWGMFLVQRGLVEREAYEAANARFYEDYRRGELDITAFLQFALAPLAAYPPDDLFRWRDEFIAEVIRPLRLPAACELIRSHVDQGHTPIIITATNRFITEPIARLYGIEHLLATTPEWRDGRYTGRCVGTPCFQAGKVIRLTEWLRDNPHDLSQSYFYTDSHNDIPLLEQVGYPVAVDADDRLARLARERGWPLISLRTQA
ncbi:HAD family hydrolase [Candidatus Woesearchaeota archaeon]|nr:HAD family hydrolase [Candidatus Woesearchaeota archaeon]